MAANTKALKTGSHGIKMSLGYRMTDVIIYTLMGLVGIFTLLPFLYIFSHDLQFLWIHPQRPW